MVLKIQREFVNRNAQEKFRDFRDTTENKVFGEDSLESNHLALNLSLFNVKQQYRQQ